MLIVIVILIVTGLTIRLIVLEGKLFRLHREYDALYEEHRPLAIQLRDISYDDDLTHQIEEAYNVWRYGSDYKRIIELQEFKKFLINNKDSICADNNKNEFTNIDFFDMSWIYNIARRHDKDIKYHFTWYGYEETIKKIDNAMKDIDKYTEHKLMGG